MLMAATPKGPIHRSQRAWRIARYARKATSDQTSFGSHPQYRPHEDAAQIEPGVGRGDQPGRVGGMRALETGAEHVFEHLHMVARARPHVRYGAGVRDEFSPLGQEVAVAQPAVVLTTRVDDPAYGLIGDAAACLGDVAGTQAGGAAVDQHRPTHGEHQADVGIQRLVLACAAAEFADVDIDPFGHFLETDFDRV